MKSLPSLKRKCQEVFNEMIRERDKINPSCFKCISCGQIKPVDQMHAGHYYNIGMHDGLRYDEDNCHGQCNYCNTFLHGNLIEYTKNLPLKIGTKRYEALQMRAGYYKRHGHKWHRFELEAYIEHFKMILLKIKESKESKSGT